MAWGWLVIAVFSWASARAGEPCARCEAYEQFRPLVQLSQQVAAVGLRAIDDGTAPFWQSPEGRMAYMLQLEGDARIPDGCKKQFSDRSTIELYARKSVDTLRPRVVVEGQEAGILLRSFDGLAGAPGRAPGTPAIGSFKQLMDRGDWEGVKSAAQGMQSLPVEQRLAILKMFTGRMEQYYDKTLKSEAPGATQPNPADIFRALKHNQAIGYFGQPDWKGPTPMQISICRHAAFAGAQLAEALGFKNAAIVTYSHASNMGHATFTFMDGRTTHVMNAGIHAASAGVDGSRSLNQRMGDISLQYNLHRASDGRQVAAEATQMGHFLAQAAGFDSRKLGNEMAQSYTSMIAPSFRYGPQGMFESRVFYGTDGNGASYVGAAQSAQTPVGRFVDGKLGVVGYDQARPAELYAPAGTPYAAHNPEHLTGIYSQVQLNLRSPTARIPLADLQARIEATATGFLNVAASHGGGQYLFPATNVDHGVVGSAGVRVTQGGERAFADGKKFWATYFAGLTALPGGSDVRQQSSVGMLAGAPVPVINDFMFSAEARQKLCAKPDLAAPGCAYLFAHALVLADYFGVRGQGEAGVAIDNFAASVGVRGRLTEDLPSYREGATRAVTANVRQRLPIKGALIDVGAQGQQKLEAQDPGQVVQGTLRVTY